MSITFSRFPTTSISTMDPLATTLLSQSPSSTGQRSNVAGEDEEPRKKPKKVNSEIRKQQNRIASRNYREKRKRKLQYLQQLIKDDSDGQQETELSPEPQNVYARSLSADYEFAGPSSSPYRTPSASDFSSVHANSTVAPDPILATNTTTFNTHNATVAPTYPLYPQNWTAPIYPHHPPASVSWNNTPTWVPAPEYIPQPTPRSPMYPYIHPQTQAVYERAHTPSNQPQQFLANTAVYDHSASYGLQHQKLNIPNYFIGHEASSFERSIYI
ncbi:bZIP-2 multi-domain protein [Pyrenophora teres f. maculata]|nr:bZIP-2 multi-domain protein [Pyrenophora teres f. maculata]